MLRAPVPDPDTLALLVIEGPTDLMIRVSRDDWDPKMAGDVRRLVLDLQHQIRSWARTDPSFLGAMEPYDPPAGGGRLVTRMMAAARVSGVGPMAAVAGAVGAAVLEHLRAGGVSRVLVENGGDIVAAGLDVMVTGIYAGGSDLSLRVALEVDTGGDTTAVCCSSATVGHALSLGDADAAVIVAPDAALADAAATALGNRVSGPGSIEGALTWAAGVPGVRGAVVISGREIGAWGAVKLRPWNGVIGPA